MNKTTAFLFILVHLCAPLQAQYSITGLDLDGTLDTWYDTVFVGKNPELLEGSFYKMPGRTRDDHPFLGDGQWSRGTITFRGQEYDDIAMIYDLMNSALVIRNTSLLADSREFLRINPRQVSTFTLYDFRFLRYDRDYCPPAGTGFYKLLYEGKGLNLIVQIIKTNRVSFQGLVYDRQEKYYIEDQNGFFRVRGKRDFYLRYEEHKKTIKRHIRSRRLKVQRGNDEDFARLMAFCEQFESTQ